ncbi:pentatricopeptide repeat-containing protein At4g02750-like [Selaginella moellendorffii]|uniref:pentatricopeptide repeat-containing protein At4g02750-like n=1 Tax=Selaginella moellendorffii TaxID=88036 RepID=UPI000D1C52D5|nr:pentatricopeptide repeat-containing protein At4g02750-like [Selaginella moellendorffii]|eukprot:XP_024515728.1 pentatricopeptide repeat-containing protein At4g02750-like [Selaginella moellendorffii]
MDNGLASAIRSCRDLDQARQLHRQWEGAKESSGSLYLGNLLIETYGKCGHPECSRKVFDSLRLPNTFSWNLLISAYARNGFLHEAQELFAAMSPRSLVAANVMITAYARKGHVIDAKNVYDSMLEHSSVSWSAMIAAFLSAGDLGDACDLLQALPERDITCSNLVIAAYAQAGHLPQAKRLFDEMRHRDIATWNAMLEALAGARDDVIEMERFFETMMPGWSAASLTILVTSLARHGCFDEARVAFEARPQLHDLVSWTALLAGFALHRDGNEDIQESENIFFHKMPLHNHVTWTMMLAAYARHTDLSRRASEFFHENLPQHSIASSNTAMAIHVQAGKMDRARALFMEWSCETSRRGIFFSGPRQLTR